MKSLEMPIRQGGDGVSGKSIISNSYLEDIGDAIRYKKGSEDTYYPSQMGDAIRSIEGIVPAGTIEIDANGTYDVTEYVEAVVDVSSPFWKTVTLSEKYDQNGIYNLMNFLGIPSQDVLDGYIFYVECVNNQDTSNYAFKCAIIEEFADYKGEVNAIIIRRVGYTNVIFGHANNVSMYMTAGSIINIYRFK